VNDPPRQPGSRKLEPASVLTQDPPRIRSPTATSGKDRLPTGLTQVAQITELSLTPGAKPQEANHNS
jgi:hypothetical protein